LIALPTLIALVESLMAEKVLLRRDGHTIEEHLFQQADASGRWTMGAIKQKYANRHRAYQYIAESKRWESNDRQKVPFR
jgi:hypothetical protein